MNELGSLPMKLLSDTEQHDMLIDLFKEIKLLTGAVLHSGEELLYQVNVLKMFLTSHPKFTSLTIPELRHAFYLNSQGEYGEVHKHYNKELNAEFVGAVLLSYLRYKRSIYARNGQVISSVLAPAEVVKHSPLTEKQLQQIIQQHYDLYLNGDTEYIYLLDSVYYLLRKYGAICYESRLDHDARYFTCMDARARESKRRQKRYEDETALEQRHIYSHWGTDKFTGVPKDERIAIRHLLRKRMYLQFLKRMQYFGIHDIFKEVYCVKCIYRFN